MPPTWDRRSLLGSALDLKIAERYGLSGDQFENLDLDLQQALQVLGSVGEAQDGEMEEEEAVVVEAPFGERLVSYLVGIAFGRWDVLIGKQPTKARPLGDPFDPMTASPPGMLVGSDGLPASAPPDGYPPPYTS